MVSGSIVIGLVLVVGGILIVLRWRFLGARRQKCAGCGQKVLPSSGRGTIEQRLQTAYFCLHCGRIYCTPCGMKAAKKHNRYEFTCDTCRKTLKIWQG